MSSLGNNLQSSSTVDISFGTAHASTYFKPTINQQFFVASIFMHCSKTTTNSFLDRRLSLDPLIADMQPTTSSTEMLLKQSPPSPPPGHWHADEHELDDPKAKDNLAGSTL